MVGSGAPLWSAAEVGGSAASLDSVRPVLETFCSKVLHLGAVGHGQLAKALNNCHSDPKADQ